MANKLTRLSLMFKLFRLNHIHWKLVKLYLKRLKLCLYQINKIGIPINEVERATIKKLLSMYDETIQEISKEADRGKTLYRGC